MCEERVSHRLLNVIFVILFIISDFWNCLGVLFFIFFLFLLFIYFFFFFFIILYIYCALSLRNAYIQMYMLFEFDFVSFHFGRWINVSSYRFSFFFLFVSCFFFSILKFVPPKTKNKYVESRKTKTMQKSNNNGNEWKRSIYTLMKAMIRHMKIYKNKN